LRSATKPFNQIKRPHSLATTPLCLCCCILFALSIGGTARGQSGVKPKPVAPTPTPAPALTRTTTRHEVRRFGYGNTLSIYGPPNGSITIEAWPRSELDITADIELHADSEADLARLATVNGFVLDEDNTHITIVTTGTHDRKFMKRVAKDFPKNLLGLPWKIDYHLRVPVALDLDIYTGAGPLTVNGVEGALQIKASESNTSLTLTGGDVQATIASGSVSLRVPVHSWRGRGVSLQLVHGDLTVELPVAFNADIDANVLRAGRIENQDANLAPRERTTPTDHNLQARAGAGGVPFNFEVGDGTITIKTMTSDK
jgi:hypothetical protein